ncbi:MAG: hypothetical protein ACSHWN_05585 [Methylophilaceae bacterium]
MLNHEFLPLDPRQEQRIEAVHRGFLYQHLYAVGCLLLAARAGILAVVIERDEDIEVIENSRRLYVQVKTRSALLIPSDIKDVLLRFEDLRLEHAERRRDGSANFVIVSNQLLSPALAALVDEHKIPDDVSIIIPGHDVPEDLKALPPAWQNIAEAVHWCISIAETLPYAQLTPESLVWKLAGRVQLAASGGTLHPDHTFRVDALPALFEQLLVQLQDFPAPPVIYRPQIDEPILDSDQRVRIICGFSGAGKTAWASQAAMHSKYTCAYFDVGDIPGTAIATSLVRELAINLMETAPVPLSRVLLPGASGVESLHTLDTYLGQNGLSPVLVFDNVQRVPVDNLRAILEATSHLRFVLLCQPNGSIPELEALMGLSRESLSGWNIDTIAAEVTSIGAWGSVAIIQNLQKLTAGSPLYVRSSAKIAVSEYGGDLSQLCEALETQTHTTEIAQEIILAKVFEAMPALTRDAVAILSLVDIALNNLDVGKLLNGTLNLTKAGIANIIRNLRRIGVIEVYANQQMKIHDAMRVLGKRHLEIFDPVNVRQAKIVLKDILAEALYANRDTSKFSLFIQMLISLGELKPLVEIAGQEMFHEMGIGGEIWSALEAAAVSDEIDPEERFWALDGLVFSELKSGATDKLPQRFDAMKQLLDTYTLQDDEKLAYMMKRMLYQAALGNLEEVLEYISKIKEFLPDKPGHQRIFRYNAACALWQLDSNDEAEEIAAEVINEYYDVIGITPSDVMGKNANELWPLLTKTITIHEDIKHLADSLELLALILNKKGLDARLLRIHAMKFYEIANAPDSLIRVGQDMTDEFITQNDFVGARESIEKFVLPHVIAHNMINKLVAVRSQYAVILAYCGEHNAADAEMARLAPYESGFSELQKSEIDGQLRIIKQLRLKTRSNIELFIMKLFNKT